MQVIPLKYGRVFKRVFSQPPVFQQFVADVLGITINVDKIHTEYEYPEPVGFVSSRYDLFAEDKEQRIVVEIQHFKEPDFFNRFLYYHLTSIIEQVKDGPKYWFDRTVYTIVVLTSVPRDGSINFSCATSDFNPVNEFNQKILVYQHRLVFLVPRLVSASTPDTIRRWLEFITDSLDGEMLETDYADPMFRNIVTDIRRSTLSPEERAEILDEQAWEQAQALFFAERGAESRAEGLAEGLAKGKIAGKMQLLERLIIRRFGAIPIWAQQQLDQANAEQIATWAEAIFDAQDLEQLLQRN